ncbi:hypothetical protein DM52_5021 [Burkholderia mallei]|nr:hypothetical protein DM52_5021 [Burkholderia mallei]
MARPAAAHHDAAAEQFDVAALHQRELTAQIDRDAVPRREPVVPRRHHVDADLQARGRLRMDRQPDRIREPRREQRAPRPAALDHAERARLRILLQRSLRAAIVGREAVLEHEAGHRAIQQRALFVGHQPVPDRFDRIGEFVDEPPPHIVEIRRALRERFEVLEVVRRQAVRAQRRDELAERVLIRGDVAVVDANQIAEHTAVRADRQLRAGCVEAADPFAQIVEERQRQLLGHVRQPPEHLVRIRRFRREGGQHEFDRPRGVDERPDSGKLNGVDLFDLVTDVRIRRVFRIPPVNPEDLAQDRQRNLIVPVAFHEFRPRLSRVNGEVGFYFSGQS